MTNEQMAAVERTFARIEGNLEAAMMAFYGRLFELDPGLRAMFRGPREEQARKLAQVLTVVVRSLRRLEQILPAVREMGTRHDKYGVQPEHYATVGAALLWTLEQGLGDEFTEDVRQAWGAAYGVLAEEMMSGARACAFT